ncbi:hypothetical protein COO60DRAFT_1646854 [Scenedesmus sp. NREL 46B-D3]|nr:hypothetical protein COO60DRAFT_1646854 [Scenedesmus sp. NREL 46B-D3]
MPSSKRWRAGAWVTACALLLAVAFVTYLQGDVSIAAGGKLVFPANTPPGALVEVVKANQSLGSRHGLGVYPGESMRMFAAGKGDMRLSFAQDDGSFVDAVLVTKHGDMGLGVEPSPSTRLHVGGNMAVNGSVAIGPYLMSATSKGLQVCRQGGGRCQYVFDETFGL